MARNTDDLILPAWVIAMAMFAIAIMCAYGIYKAEKYESQFNATINEQQKALENMRKAVDR